MGAPRAIPATCKSPANGCQWHFHRAFGVTPSALRITASVRRVHELAGQLTAPSA